MSFNKELTIQEKVEKAVWAANIFTKHNYRNYDVWVIEYVTTVRQTVGNLDNTLKQVLPKDGITENVIVRAGIAKDIKYGWWEAVAIAEALESQKYLPD